MTVYDEPPTATGAPNTWENRLVGHEDMDPLTLSANPRNWRCHPKAQQEAISEVLGQVGWVASIMVNRRSGFVVDGHARVALAIAAGEPTVPVDLVDLTDQEEAMVIATFDPIAALAGADAEAVRQVKAELGEQSAAITAVINRLATAQNPDHTPRETVMGEIDQEDAEAADDEGETKVEERQWDAPVQDEYMCPHCGHTWSEDEPDGADTTNLRPIVANGTNDGPTTPTEPVQLYRMVERDGEIESMPVSEDPDDQTQEADADDDND